MQPKYLIGTLFQQEQINKKMNQSTIKNKDPFGNTRWQGAFTGGFSAGYKNTCGSKQGWQPATFVSSISNRAKQVQQNVLDFMDKEDLVIYLFQQSIQYLQGKQSIHGNIEINQGFRTLDKNSFNIVVEESIGGKILAKLRKSQAQQLLPQNQQDLQKLLKYYEKQEQFQNKNYGTYNLKDIQKPYSVGVKDINVLQHDQFIQAYDNLYKKVIRQGIKEQTQEQIAKRRQQNKVYFDFTKPIEQQPQYLKQIHDIEQLAQPKKRRRNVLNSIVLKDLFTSAIQFKQFKQQSLIQKAPQEYDPYHRVRRLKQQFSQLTSKQKQLLNPFVSQQHQLSSQVRHRIHTTSQRSNILGFSSSLSNRFQSGGTNSFILNDKKVQEYKNFFKDLNKNQRYIDYVDELEGRKIISQSYYMTFQEQEKEKKQFEEMYKKQKEEKNNKNNKNYGNLNNKSGKMTHLPKQIEKALEQKNIQNQKVKIKRTVTTWKPEKLLCNRFGCLVPYKIQSNENKQKKQQYF